MSPPFRRRLFWLCPLVLTAGGCAAQGSFPSLLPREAERNVSLEEPVRQRAAVAREPGLREQAAELLALARRGEASFEAAVERAGAAAGRAGAPGSDSWVTAQEAISRAEAARADTVQALAELDALATMRAAQPTNADDFDAIHAAVDEARRLLDEQQARLERLRARVRPG